MNREQLKQKPFYLSEEEVVWVESTLADMTVEEKLGQIFCANIREGSREEIEGLMDLIPLGAVMYRPLPVENAINLTNYLKKSKIPMLIAADLERGGNGVLENGTKFCAQMEIAATGNEKHAERLAEVCGREGAAVGVNWSFAPVVDIDMNYRNPMTNVRTYGDDAERVARMGTVYMKKIQSMGIAASVKHFPGDGVDERDHHLVTTVNTLDKEKWDETYGKVYQKCIDEGAMTIMAGHIMLPSYSRYFCPDIRDDDILPCTLSKELMQNLLREQMGFNGLIVTDASTMSGFTIPMKREDAVPTTIAAGADMFLFSRNMKEDVGFMKKGLERGLITQERLDDAVTRILALKAALKLYKEPKKYTVEEAEKEIGRPEYHQWAKECADQAVTLVKEEKGVLPVTPEKYKRLMFFPLEGTVKGFGAPSGVCDKFRRMLEDEGFEVTQFNPEKAAEGRIAPMSDFIGVYDVMVYFACIPTVSNRTTVRIEWASPFGANCPHFVTAIPTIFISVENPYHLQDVPRVRTFINAYSSNDEVLEAVLEKLTGRSAFEGTSPVDAFCGRWDTHLM